MTKAFEVLVPVLVTMGLAYGAAWHGRFGADQVPILNKMVLLYAVPMSISVGILRLSRHALVDHAALMLVLILGLALIDAIAFGLIRWVFRRDLGTSALQAMAISFPAVPFIGPSLLTPLFGSDGAILIAAVALGGNILIVPFTMMCLSMAEAEDSQYATDTSLGTHLRAALVHGVSQPIVWAPVLSLIIVLAGVQMGSTFDDSLALLGAAGGGVGLFTTGIVLRSQSAALTRPVIASVVGKNVVTPLAMLGAAYLVGQGAHGGEIAVTTSILAAPIITTLAIENRVAIKEMSSTLLLSALASIVTTGAFIVFAT